jgi:hypothetical protein
VRSTVFTLLLTAAAALGAAEQRFSLGLEGLPLTEETPASESAAEDLRHHLTVEVSEDGFDDALVYSAALEPRSEQEFRLALWNSPMGRLHYERAAADAMLGREGLVSGGRMQGLGLATSTLGDGGPGGIELVMKTKWSELTFSDKVQAGIEASFLSALVYYMAANAD